MSAVASERLSALAARRLFSAGATTYTWGDALLWADASGCWAAQRRASRRGLVHVRRAADVNVCADAEALRTAATEFRRRRSLLSADELTAWLRRWSLTVEEWGSYLERRLLIARSGVERLFLDPRELVSPAAEVEFVDAVCSGFLEQAALGFAADVALAAPTPQPTTSDRAGMVAQTRIAAAAARELVKTQSSVERAITHRGLGWTRLDIDRLELAERGAALEAVLCFRLDGRSLEKVAEDCGESLSRVSVYIDDLSPAERPLLVGAQPGDLAGPVEAQGRFLLLAVRARTPATASDPVLRRRAQAALIEAAVQRALAAHVEWHEHL